MKSIICFVFLVLLLAGCDDSSEIKELNFNIDKLERKISNFNESNDNLKNKVEKTEKSLALVKNIVKERINIVNIHLKEKNIEKVDKELRSILEEVAKIPYNKLIDLRKILQWLVWVAINALSVVLIFDIFDRNKGKRKTSMIISIVISFMFIAVLFDEKMKYPSILYNNTHIIETSFFSVSLIIGWVVLYIGRIAKYGDFFYIFIFSFLAGISWYERFHSPVEIQYILIAVLIGALSHIGKIYIDNHSEVN